MRILTIVPSIYPLKLATMMDSYLMTRSECNDIRINYEKGSITKIINSIFNANQDYDYYFVANDDCVFKTEAWDIKLARKGKITHGADSIPEGVAGQFFMIDGKIARAVGWLQMPTLNRYCGDVVWRFIGQSLDILEHVPTVEIAHNWDGCAEPMVNTLDMERFAIWLPEAYRDLDRIRKVL